MKVLILGSGGREHVLAWKAVQSKHISDVFVAPGNAGTDEIAKNVDLKPTDFSSVVDFCLEHSIDVLVPGNEDPLVLGIVDYIAESEANNVYVFGPNKEAALLEGSKEFAKAFMAENNIPTAAYEAFTAETIEDAKSYLRTKAAPYVLKADGLAAGKGVILAQTLEEADRTLDEMLLDAKFGDASSRVVIEDFITGVEFSIFAMSDGANYIILPEAKDYKRIGEGDTGLNTGGMGAVSPVPFMTPDFMQKVVDQVIDPTFKGLRNRSNKFVGFVFFGLINDNGQPKVIEYNVRMGDPETEVVFPRLKNDFGELLDLARNGKLGSAKVDIDPRTCTTVFTVSGGYPETYEKGKSMSIGQAPNNNILFFHAGTKRNGQEVVTYGGRVLAVTAFGSNIQEALQNSYSGVNVIEFEGKNYRTDIGKDLMAMTT